MLYVLEQLLNHPYKGKVNQLVVVVGGAEPTDQIPPLLMKVHHHLLFLIMPTRTTILLRQLQCWINDQSTFFQAMKSGQGGRRYHPQIQQKRKNIGNMC